MKKFLSLFTACVLILLSVSLFPCLPEIPGVTVPAAAAETAGDWDEPEGGYDPEDWRNPETPENLDLPVLPFLLVNVEGREPAINRESEWVLKLKDTWEDRDLPSRVKSVKLRLYCHDMDWKDSWCLVWKKDYEGFPETMVCGDPKVSGWYHLVATVYTDDEDEWVNITAGFTLEGPGMEQITDLLNAAAGECRVPGDEWQTAMNLYQWLLDHMTYDDTLSFSSSDAILRGTGVCDSYSRLYAMLCRAAGLEVYVINGKTNAGYHAWDAVKIDGKWYFADPTWDDHPDNDPAMDYSQPTTDENGLAYGVLDYRYFMLNTELATMNGHVTYEWLDASWLRRQEQPTESLDANYYVHTGRCAAWGIGEGDSFRTVPELVRDAFAAGETMWSSRSINNKPIFTRGFSDPPFLAGNTERILLGWALKGMSVTLPDGKEITLDTYSYKMPDESGWVVNVFPEGHRETDEPLRVEIPAGTKRIEAGAYENDPHCGEVICPPGLESIESRAFANCRALWSVHIPSDVKSIAEDAFEGSPEFCIWTESRDSVPARFAEEHNIPLFIYEEMEGSNG